MAFHCVNDGVPETTVRLLREACAKRGVPYVEVDARRFEFDEEQRLGPGELLYRPAVSLAAMRVEQFLYGEGVATFHRDPDGIFFSPSTSPLLFERAGLCVPRTFYCHGPDRGFLMKCVDRLGGFPVVVKLMGYSRGIGVMRADSMPALYSLVDFAVAEGKTPILAAFVEEAVHWRVNVVGDRAVAAYRNIMEHNDFRTYAGTDPKDYTADVRADLADAAVRAVRALHLELGGVDLLEHASGRIYLLESNFPCYFGTAQEVIGVDIAGAMIEHLIAKSVRLAAEGARARG